MPTVTSAPGVFTALNELEAPEGSLIRAENCVIRNKDVIEPRRGFFLNSYDYGGTPGVGNNPQASKQGFFYQDTLHVLYNQTAAPVTSKLAYDTGSAFTDYTGSYYGADESLMRMKTVSFRNNLYMATTNGIYKISNVGNTPETAGVPQSHGYVPHNTGNLAPGNQIYALATAGGRFVTVTNSDYAGQFVTNEKIYCTSSDANFPSGTKTVISTNGTSFRYRDPAGGVSGYATGTVYYQTQPLVDISGFLQHNYQCAYRFVLDIPDNNQQILLGPPSERFVVANKSGTTGYVSTETKNVQLRISLPSNLPSNTRLWIYRSEQTPTTVPPSEELFKVYEYTLSSEDISRKLVVIKDIVEDVLLEEPIYTSPTAETALNANYKPIKAKDVASWSNRLWFSNTTSTYEIVLRLLALPTGTITDYRFDIYSPSVGGSESIYLEDSVSATYSGDVNFLVVNDPGNTFSQNIEATSRNLVAAINKYSAFAEAFYESGVDDPPGIIRIVSRSNSEALVVAFNTGYQALLQRSLFDPILPWTPTIDLGSITADLSRAGSTVTVTPTSPSLNFFRAGELIIIPPGIPDFTDGTYTIVTATDSTFTYTDAGSTVTASGVLVGYAGPFTDSTMKREEVVNRVYFSKLQQGEAVPLLNYLDVGAPGKQILRIIPLRERLYVFKEDGIFTIAGEFPFRVDLLDDTAKLLAADTCAVVGNQIFCLTSQGVVSVGESGVGIISRPWETDLFNQVQQARNAGQLASSWGVGYESDRNYLLEIGLYNPVSPYIYVYNYLNRVWTQWIRNQQWGAVHPVTDKLYLGPQQANIRSVHIERKTTYEYTFDYADEKITFNLVSADSGTPSTMVVSGAVLPNVGDILYAGSSPEITYGDEIAVVTARSGFNVTFEYLLVDNGFEAYVGTSIYAYRKYPVTLQWNALHAGAPAVVKQFDEWSPIFNVRNFTNARLSFQGDSASVNNTTKNVISNPFFTNGRSILDGGLTMARVNPISKRVAIPRDLQRCTNLTVTFIIDEAMAYWRLLGFNYEATPISPLANRKA